VADVALATALIGVGTMGDARQSVVEPERVTQQQHDLPSSVCYAVAIGLLLWGMLRLPVRRTGRFRFALDSLTITATVGVFAWYFTMRALGAGNAHRTTLPMLTLAVLGLIVALALVKVAMSGPPTTRSPGSRTGRCSNSRPRPGSAARSAWR
jgi:hypothetical protein